MSSYGREVFIHMYVTGILCSMINLDLLSCFVNHTPVTFPCVLHTITSCKFSLAFPQTVAPFPGNQNFSFTFMIQCCLLLTFPDQKALVMPFHVLFKASDVAMQCWVHQLREQHIWLCSCLDMLRVHQWLITML